MSNEKNNHMIFYQFKFAINVMKTDKNIKIN